MSELREHLQKARDEHQAMQYPGNLARDIFAAPVIEYADRNTQQRSVLFRILAGAGALSAMAAAVVLFLWLHYSSVTVKKVYVMSPPPPQEATPFVLSTAPMMPQNLQIVPRDLPSNLAPDYQPISVSSVPTFWDLNSDSSDTSNKSSNSKEPA